MDLNHVREHYRGKILAAGHTPQGVDWKDEAAQMDRLNALCLLFGNDFGYTVNDWGCGYGRLAWMTKHSRYSGYDIVPQKLNRGEFTLSDKPTQVADYTVASGIFNVKGAILDDEWRGYMLASIDKMAEMSSKGFGFNALCDRAPNKRYELYYANSDAIAAFCGLYGRVSVLRYYNPFDFTIMVNKC